MQSVALKFFVLFTSFLKIHGISDFKIANIDNCTSFKSTLIVERCEITKNQTLNFVFDMLEPEKMFQLDLTFMKAENNRMRTVFKTPKFDWCLIVSKTIRSSSTFIKNFLSNNQNKIPAALKRCPIKGERKFLTNLVNHLIIL